MLGLYICGIWTYFPVMCGMTGINVFVDVFAQDDHDKASKGI